LFAYHLVRARAIFYAEPEDLKAPLKTIPDFESQCAEWISYEELVADLKSGKKHLRGNEPFEWFGYLANGGKIFPMEMFTLESATVKVF
jgi:hypothetical protein